MLNIALIDGVSNYCTDSLIQWDSDQKLKISGVTLTKTPVLHFVNKKSAKALVIEPEKSSGVLTVPIPNSLLIEPYPIVAYLYSYDNDEGKTVVTIEIPVEPRPQPDDYVYTGDSGFITLASINAKVDAMISQTNSDYAAFKGLKTQEIDNLIATKGKALDDLAAAQKKNLEDLYTAEKDKLDQLYTDKSAELTQLGETLTQRVDDAIAAMKDIDGGYPDNTPVEPETET